MDIKQNSWKPDIPEDRKCSHLFLLIGSNPLPNAVAAKCLIQEDASNKCIYLIHTNETKAIAEKLQKWIVRNNLATDEHFRFVHIDPSGAESIYPNICACLNELNGHASNLAVGLNYTGGTSAMGIHAYRAMDDWAKQSGAIPIFSYLDARTLEICFDPKDISAGQTTQRIYVGRVHVGLEELIDLHGWSIHRKLDKPILYQTARAIAKVFSEEQDAKDWNTWWTCQFKLAESDPQNKEKFVLLPCCSNLHTAASSLECELRAHGVELNDGRFNPGAAKAVLGYRNNSFKVWLDGEWLDNYCMSCVQEIKNDVTLNEIVMDMQTSEIEFQSDVITVRGYQLFYFTCTTKSGKSEVKQKLFEAYIRARQLAGDHARVALVCCTGEPDIIAKEVRRALQTEGQIKVFGRSSLINLASEIKDWINLNKGNDPGGGY